ncbi:hypothetical protein [uncultured Methanobrevibacter sp.]|nr:hypothetical protein [uncultured Methanobrevibacter sp.]
MDSAQDSGYAANNDSVINQILYCPLWTGMAGCSAQIINIAVNDAL